MEERNKLEMATIVEYDPTGIEVNKFNFYPVKIKEDGYTEISRSRIYILNEKGDRLGRISVYCDDYGKINDIGFQRQGNTSDHLLISGVEKEYYTEDENILNNDNVFLTNHTVFKFNDKIYSIDDGIPPIKYEILVKLIKKGDNIFIGRNDPFSNEFRVIVIPKKKISNEKKK